MAAIECRQARFRCSEVPSVALRNAHFGTRSGHGFGPRSSRSPAAPSTVFTVTETVDLTIVFEPEEDGWIVASIPQLPGVHSQGRTREEAREMVLSALQDWLRWYVEDQHGTPADKVPADADAERLHLTFAE